MFHVDLSLFVCNPYVKIAKKISSIQYIQSLKISLAADNLIASEAKVKLQDFSSRLFTNLQEGRFSLSRCPSGGASFCAFSIFQQDLSPRHS